MTLVADSLLARAEATHDELHSMFENLERIQEQLDQIS